MIRRAEAWLLVGLLGGALAGVAGVGCSSGGDDDSSGGGAATTGGSGGAVSNNGSGGAGNMTGSSGGTSAAGTNGGGGTGSMSSSGGSGGSMMAGGGGGGTATPDGGVVPTGGGATWVGMGYDETNTYFNPGEHTLSVDNAATLVEKWRFTVAGYPPGSPVVAEGKVFVMSSGGTYAINLDDGKMVWSHTDISGSASMFYADGSVYAHASVGAKLYKLKASDGTIEWGPVVTYSLADCDGTSSPIVGGGKVLVGHSCGALELGAPSGPRGGVEAFDIATGALAWTYYTVPETGEDGGMVWSTVTVDVAAGVVFAGSGNNYSVQGDNSDSIHAIDLATGKRKWKTQVRNNDTWSLAGTPDGPDTDFGANPILAEVGGKKIIADGDKGSAFWAFDRETGDVLWSHTDLSSARNAANGGVLNNGAFDGKYFYVVANQPPGQAVLHALDPLKEGADAWPPKTFEKLTWGALSVANGLLLVPSNDDLLIFNAATGEQLKMFNTGGTIAAGAAAIVDGKIIVKSGLEYILDGSVTSNNLVICYGLP